MRKDKRYTRAELESVRRADLQSLYKTHGLKGANKTTNLLIDDLLELFDTPAFISRTTSSTGGTSSSSSTIASKPSSSIPSRLSKPSAATKNASSPRKHGHGRPAPYPRKLNTIETQIPPGKAPIRTRDAKPRRSDKSSAKEVVDNAPPVLTLESHRDQRADTAEIPTEDAPMIAGPSKSKSPSLPRSPPYDIAATLSSLQDRLHRLEMQNNHLMQSLDAKDKKLQINLTAAEQRWEARLASERAEWEQRFIKLEETLHNIAGPSSARRVVSFADHQQRDGVLGKRGLEASSSSSTKRSTADSKRPRIDPHGGPNGSSVHIPTFESAPTADSPGPHTPPPSHQGILPDMSKTPIVGPEYFANGPHPDSRLEDLPYPIFATTPRPSEPQSPTTDAPPSASRHRTALPSKGVLTPGRRRPTDAAPVSTSRAVSDAHKELSTITEESTDAVRLGRVRQSSGTPGPLLGPVLRGEGLPGSPRQLSASPSIPGDREGFSYTPFPPVPKSSSRGSRVVESKRPTTPPRQVIHSKGNSSSPAQDYMEVALQTNDPALKASHIGPDISPSAYATPSHRTMLGTETYRDTRFGDVPVMSWGTPSVDLGTGTPRTSLGRSAAP
ncbi:hypothetical protein BD324DRAFT_636829 [Kockovaella imperatae]|uniref:Uncharacterized protein n=1 Tax=Kockovaella imperatae TaxID=4999 RepID=A0A1Y1U7X9_9TREE|nr:hypothetical protein BD324DRAFT_636829 [Kockovaella imperatae]ORX34139.1 hypothetical protein BD324DRAFT_636829 [Kockovaella imperatae]